jgi:hypothetical protein
MPDGGGRPTGRGRTTSASHRVQYSSPNGRRLRGDRAGLRLGVQLDPFLVDEPPGGRGGRDVRARPVAPFLTLSHQFRERLKAKPRR